MGARPEAACVLGSSNPPNQRRAAERKYLQFEAAAQGCQVCVAHYLEVEQVDPASKSGSRQYSVLDWAHWARQDDVAGALGLLGREVAADRDDDGHGR